MMKINIIRLLSLFNLLIFYNISYSQNFILEKISNTVNSSKDEITPVPSRDGRVLYFTRVGYPEFEKSLFLNGTDLSQQYDGPRFTQELSGIFSNIAGMNIVDPVSSSFNQDIWMANLDSAGAVLDVEHPGFPLNNALPNSIVSITPDPNAFYIINKFAASGGMEKGFSLVRKMPDGSFSFPEPLEIKDYYTITSDVSLTLSFDGQILILSAERADSEDMDLYVCFKEGEMKWGSPMHLGKVVNSEKRETTPFLSEDNTTLFFSSNRGGTMGGNDIFMTKRLDDTWKNWTAPVPLAEPINSMYDDSQPYFNMTTGYLYLTSRRAGNSDIYRVQIAPPQPTEISVIGRVINGETGELVSMATVYYGSEGGPKNAINAENGYYKLKIPKGIKFELVPEKPGYTGNMETIYFRRDYYFFQDNYVVDLVMNPLKVNARIELKPIFFQQSKAILYESSYPELERLASILFENPKISIMVEGHTDNQGRAEDLVRLSEERAKAIKEFLVKRGISAYRIETIGYGAKFPATENTSEESRQKNRRVEIRITKV